MSLKDDQDFARENSRRIIASFPSALLKKEASLADRLAVSKLSPLKKLAAIYELVDEMAKHIAPATPCRKGCSSCCHYAVSISEVEAQYIERIAKKRRIKTTAGFSSFDGDPCPFLERGACSIYAARPFVCRRFHTFAPTAEWCVPDKSFLGDFPKAYSSEAQLAFDLVREMGKLGDIRQVFGPAKQS